MREGRSRVIDSLTMPDSYDKQLFQRKRDSVFDAILNYALRGVKFAA